MASERQIAANRRNAQKSTGPRTRMGKQRASGNAYRHGLSSRRTTIQLQAEEVERLAQHIAGDSKSLMVLEWARTVAEAQLELARVRHMRAAIIDHIAQPGRLPKLHPFSSLPDLRRLGRWVRRPEMSHADQGSKCAANVPPNESDQTSEAIRHLLPQLKILDRYERRAWSRRENGLRSIQRSLADKS